MNDSPLSPEAVAQMVADREAGTPGPWMIGHAYRSIVSDANTGYDRPDDVDAYGGHLVCESVKWDANARRIARLPDLEAAYLTLAAENAALRAEFELLTAVKDAHKMRGDNHWETLRSIRVLAQEGKLDHIIQHVNDAGAGYTQPDHVTMWELQSALAVANDRIATLRASEAAELIAAHKRIAEMNGALDSLLDAITASDMVGDRSLTITGPTANLKWLLEAEEEARDAIGDAP